MLHAATTSPIGPLVSFAAEHPTVTGLVIAFGEVAVGLGTLLGLFTHIAALGGFLLALSFFLTVSWTTRPYYFGADIVFAAAWTPLLVAGDAGLFSTTARLRAAIRRRRQPNSTPDDVKRRILLWGGLITATTAALGGGVIALTRRTTTNPKPSQLRASGIRGSVRRRAAGRHGGSGRTLPWIPGGFLSCGRRRRSRARR
jgi:thiosulfate dehydrogenase [quinone] large subunit